MLPYITLFGNDVPMYGLMMLVGAALSILFACLRCKKRGIEPLDVLLTAVFALLAGLLGAKVLYIITDIPNMVAYFQNNSFSIMWLLERIARSGIVFYGGLIGGFLGGWIYTRMFALNFWRTADLMIPFLPLAHAFGRIGCFCAGCCYGRPMDAPWGWYFNNAIGAPHGVRLFPVQLFEASFLLVILFPVLLLYSRKERKPGQIVGLYLTLYAMFRFVNEYLRFDEIRGIFLGVSTSQWISLALIPVGLLLLSGVLSKHLARISSRAADGAELCDDETDGSDEYPDCAVCTDCGECARKASAKEDAQTESEENGEGDSQGEPAAADADDTTEE